MDIGLALSGGAVRGLAHIGVLKALEEAQIPISCVSGTSAGSTVGGAYAAGRTVAELEEEALRLDNSVLDFNSSGAAKALVGSFFGRRVGFRGVFRGNGVYKLADRLTGGMNVKDAPMKVALCAVDVVSGATIYFTNADIPSVRGEYEVVRDAPMAEAIAASSSIPAVFAPREYGGMSLVDGGVTDYVPVKVLRDMGAGFIIAVDLGRDSGEKQQANDLLEISARSFDIMSRRLADTSLEYADVVIAPYVADIGLFDFSRSQELMDRGYRAAKRLIPTIKMHAIRALSQRDTTQSARAR